MDFNSLSHKKIQTLHPYIPGKTTEQLARELGLTDIIKLASNENPYGSSPEVIKAISDLSKEMLAFYPNPANHPVKEAIANYAYVSKNQITLSNGSIMLIPLLITAFALGTNKHILTHEYAFFGYEVHANTLGVDVVKAKVQENMALDLEDLLSKVTKKTALIFLANPNNPTGSKISYKDVLSIVNFIPKSTIFVLDEAYYEYEDEEEKTTSLINSYPNLVITRTFSKAFGLASLRIGYALATEQITNLLHKIQEPFTVSLPAMVGAKAALGDLDFIKDTKKHNFEAIKQLKSGLDAQGHTYLPINGNFVTIKFGEKANDICAYLEKNGIIVRPLGIYSMNDYLRVSVGTPLQNKRFLVTLAEYSK